MAQDLLPNWMRRPHRPRLVHLLLGFQGDHCSPVAHAAQSMKVVWDFVNLEVASPVIGNAGSFTPSIDGIAPRVLHMTRNSTEEKFRSTETFRSM